MNPRIVWPLAILFGLAILAYSLNNVLAQRAGSIQSPPASADAFVALQDAPQPRPMGQFVGGGAGRFVVAYSSETRIVILDTATGQLYRATPDDFKKMSELPKVGPGAQFKDKERPFDKKDGGKKDDSGKTKDNSTGTAQ